jgi:hypothetical protein
MKSHNGCWTQNRQGFGLLILMGLLFTLTLSSAPATHAAPPMGINTDWNYDWSPAQYFTDMVKQSRGWGLSSLTGQQDAATRDSNGWPTEDCICLMVTYPGTGPAWPVSGAYSVTFDGQATIGDAAGVGCTVTNQVYNSTTNVTTATYNVPSAAQDIWPSFTNTVRTYGCARGPRATKGSPS